MLRAARAGIVSGSSPSAEDVAFIVRLTCAGLVNVCKYPGRDLSEFENAPEEFGQDQLALASY